VRKVRHLVGRDDTIDDRAWPHLARGIGEGTV
jgi:hypothetical protein